MSMNVSKLKSVIEGAGMSHKGCLEKSELRMLAEKAMRKNRPPDILKTAKQMNDEAMEKLRKVTEMMGGAGNDASDFDLETKIAFVAAAAGVSAGVAGEGTATSLGGSPKPLTGAERKRKARERAKQLAQEVVLLKQREEADRIAKGKATKQAKEQAAQAEKAAKSEARYRARAEAEAAKARRTQEEYEWRLNQGQGTNSRFTPEQVREAAWAQAGIDAYSSGQGM